MVKPYNTLLLLLLVIALLGAYVWAFPSGELVLNDNVKLRFVSLDEVLNPKEVKYADITNILSHEETFDADSALLGSSGGNLQADSQTQFTDTTQYSQADVDALLNIKYKIQYPEGKESLLKDFFA
ncbi:MAG: hypothetical protein ACXWDO_07085, partial [Bacteroidia bacterium]